MDNYINKSTSLKSATVTVPNRIKINFSEGLIVKNISTTVYNEYVNFVFVENEEALPETGESSKLYITLDDHVIYCWDADQKKYIAIGGKDIEIDIATTEKAGVVKSVESSVTNGVTVATDGTMSVNSISTSKLIQETQQILILDGGTASDVQS